MCSVFLDAHGVIYSAIHPPSSKWVTSLQPSEVVQFKEMAQLIFFNATYGKGQPNLLHFCPTA